MPASLSKFEKVEPIYVELDGWKEDISKAQTFSDLPTNAQNYITFIEDNLKLKVSWIGNGPKREEMIHRDVSKKALPPKPRTPKEGGTGKRGRPASPAKTQ